MAFIRDGYRCMLTGQYEATSFGTSRVLATVTVTVINFAHILPVSIADDNKFGRKYGYATDVRAVMERLGGVRLVDELNGSDIHRLENGLTLNLVKHTFFDTLTVIWLEEMATPNQYIPCAVGPHFLGDIPNAVTFASPDPQSLPLLDPKYLRLHATCAKVAHLSGAGESIDKILCDSEATRVLAKDGSSIGVLHAALTTAT